MVADLFALSSSLHQIKYYLEGSGPSVSRVEEILTLVVEELGASWMEVEKNGLQKS